MGISMWYLRKFLLRIGVLRHCPNCESAYSGGHPDPDTIEFCIVCGDSNNGARITTSLVWRWAWMNQKQVDRNLTILSKKAVINAFSGKK